MIAASFLTGTGKTLGLNTDLLGIIYNQLYVF